LGSKTFSIFNKNLMKPQIDTAWLSPQPKKITEATTDKHG